MFFYEVLCVQVKKFSQETSSKQVDFDDSSITIKSSFFMKASERGHNKKQRNQPVHVDSPEKMMNYVRLQAQLPICGNGESVKFLSQWLQLWQKKDSPAGRGCIDEDTYFTQDVGYYRLQSDYDSDTTDGDDSLKNAIGYYRCLCLKSETQEFVEQCINKMECLTIGVQKQSKGLSGYLISTRWHNNFWLLADNL